MYMLATTDIKGKSNTAKGATVAQTMFNEFFGKESRGWLTRVCLCTSCILLQYEEDCGGRALAVIIRYQLIARRQPAGAAAVAPGNICRCWLRWDIGGKSKSATDAANNVKELFWNGVAQMVYKSASLHLLYPPSCEEDFGGCVLVATTRWYLNGTMAADRDSSRSE